MTDTSTTEQKGFSPPYNIPWATFHNTIEKIAADLPSKVDRSYLGSMSGGLKQYLIYAFRHFGLIEEDGSPSEDLLIMAKDPGQRQPVMARLLQEHYPGAVALGTKNTTPDQLAEEFAKMFPSVSGESRTKAIRFVLAAMEYANLPRSSLWKAPKASPTRGRRNTSSRNGVPLPPAPPPDEPRGVRSFTLPSGHVVTLSVDCDVLALDRVERKFLLDIVDKIEDHIEGADTSGAAATNGPAPPKD